MRLDNMRYYYTKCCPLIGQTMSCILHTKCCSLINQAMAEHGRLFNMYLAGLGSKPLKSPFKEEKQGQTDGFS